MCRRANVVFLECKHEFPSFRECPEHRNGEKCKKAPGIFTEHVPVGSPGCPRCDPGYSFRVEKADTIRYLQLSKSLLDLRREAGQIAMGRTTESSHPKVSVTQEHTQVKVTDTNSKRKSTTSLESNDGGFASKLRGVFKLARTGGIPRREDLKIEPMPPSTPPMGENRRFSPTSPLTKLPISIIMPDENGFFNPSQVTKHYSAGHVELDTSVVHNQERTRRSIGSVLADESTDGGKRRQRSQHNRSVETTAEDDPRLQELLSEQDYASASGHRIGSGRRQILQHSRSEDIGAEDSRRRQEMWREQSSGRDSSDSVVPKNIPPNWPSRNQSAERGWDFSDELSTISEATQQSHKIGPSRAGLQTRSSQPLATHVGTMIGRTSSEDEIRPLASRSHTLPIGHSGQKSALQICPPEGERLQLWLAREAAEEAQLESVGRLNQQEEGNERGPLAQRAGSDHRDEFSPPPLRIPHKKKPSVDTVYEDPAARPLRYKDLPAWEQVGVDYVEDHFDPSSIVPPSRTEPLTKEEYLLKNLDTGSSSYIDEEERAANSMSTDEAQLKEISSASLAGGSGHVRHSGGKAVIRNSLNQVPEDDGAFAIDERLESSDSINKAVVRTHRELPNGRAPLPRRKTPQQLTSEEALRRADNRLKSVRDGRGYIDYGHYTDREM